MIALMVIVAAMVFVPRAQRASASTTDGVWNVIQLGDSYSAGTGARDYYGAKKCYRSNNSWAKHYVAKLDELGAPAQLDDVFACSGAVARNLYAENQELYSKTHRESDLLGRTEAEWYAWGVQACRDGLTADDVIASADVRLRGGIAGRFIDAKVDCKYQLELQATDHADQLAEADEVVLTIGGNDLGFSDVVIHCFVLPWDNLTWDPVNLPGGACQDRVDDAREQITEPESAAATDILGAFRDLKSRMNSDSQITWLTYPYLDLGTYVHGPSDVDCDANYNPSYCYRVGEKLRALQDEGDQFQKRLARLLNSEGGPQIDLFKKTKSVFAGHEPDGSRFRQNDDGWLWEFPNVTTSTDEFYHPKNIGTKPWGRALARYRLDDIAAHLNPTTTTSTTTTSTTTSVAPTTTTSPTTTTTTPTGMQRVRLHNDLHGTWINDADVWVYDTDVPATRTLLWSGRADGQGWILMPAGIVGEVYIRAAQNCIYNYESFADVQPGAPDQTIELGFRQLCF
ncbi:MAG TPA: hypothetical protein PLS46_18735 [Microthrixaceae bacterium]|nr:hypothetical protein [Microthrixaceae bacterium]